MKLFGRNFDVSVGKKTQHQQADMSMPYENRRDLIFWTVHVCFSKKQPAVFFNFWHGQVRENRSTSQETERHNVIVPPPPPPFHKNVCNISRLWVAISSFWVFNKSALSNYAVLLILRRSFQWCWPIFRNTCPCQKLKKKQWKGLSGRVNVDGKTYSQTTSEML